MKDLLKVESSENPIEIVIHVDMLREGWDVTNLYTIVPLRKANSRTLIEQSIGRGARLPFGKRTGIDLIDRLNIVSHDRFNKIIADLPHDLIDERSIEQIKIEDIPNVERVIVEPTSSFSESITDQPEISFQVESTILETSPIVSIPCKAIQIPRLTLMPDPNAKPGRFSHFLLNVRDFRPGPLDSSIISVDVASGKVSKIRAKIPTPFLDGSLEDRIAGLLLDYDDVQEAEEHEEIVIDLATQMGQHLRSYLNEKQVPTVLNQQSTVIADYIYRQMSDHYQPGEDKMIYSYGKGFVPFERASYLLPSGQEPLPYDQHQLPNGQRIETILWKGFQKSVYDRMKFDSNAERLFACCLESDEEVLKWAKPPKDKFSIYYTKNSRYEPDFVVETRNGKYLCEVKDRRFLDDPTVHSKTNAAKQWCYAASDYSDKPWSYLLIPDNQVDRFLSFAFYSGRFEKH